MIKKYLMRIPLALFAGSWGFLRRVYSREFACATMDGPERDVLSGGMLQDPESGLLRHQDFGSTTMQLPE
jgi:hypothetical protein